MTDNSATPSAPKAPVVGIDLGTTNSLVAVYRDKRVDVLANSVGDRLTPSVVAFDESGAVVVGKLARARCGYEPSAGVARFKCDMGTDRSFPLPDRNRTATELSALLLRELADSASAALGQPVQQAVITVPAYFQEPQRAATRQAAELAGLEVMRILNEPTAAAIAYGLRDAETERRAVVIDLGGGTFDVTVLDIFEGVIEVVSSTGDSRLGGENFTDALQSHVLRTLHIDEAALPPQPMATLRGACERAKRMLTTTDTTVIRLPDYAGAPWDENTVVPITREAFAEMNELRTARLRQVLRDALIQAKLTPQDIEEVVLVGGATRMHLVTELTAEMFPTPAHASLDPDQVVAMGAAIQAAMVESGGALDDVVVTDIVPFTLGVQIARDAGGSVMSGYFLPVIHRNSTIPVSATTTVSTMDPRQTEVDVKVYQGESRRTDENTLLGNFRIEGIPPLPFDPTDPYPPTQPIELTFTHDVNGLLEVEAKVQSSGKRASIVIEQAPGRLSVAEKAEAIAAMEELKRHPRELLPNRHLLELAKHRYANYDPRRRQAADPYIFAFEAALEAREPQQIEQAANNLRAILDYLGEP